MFLGNTYGSFIIFVLTKALPIQPISFENKPKSNQYLFLSIFPLFHLYGLNKFLVKFPDKSRNPNLINSGQLKLKNYLQNFQIFSPSELYIGGLILE